MKKGGKKTKDNKGKSGRSKSRTKKVRDNVIQNDPIRLGNMNCNPGVEDNKPIEESCYTSDALNEIKDAYNRNGHGTIVASEPKQIWSELRTHLSQCDKEDCWLDEIKNTETRRQMDEIMFAPDRPKDWDKNPVAWLSNYDIAAVLRQYERTYPEFKLLGPSAIDYDTKVDGDKCVWDDLCRLSLQKLINRGKTKLGVVFNLDKHYQGGSHWVSLFIDLDKQIIFYYDSALNPVPREVSRLKREIIKQGKDLEKPLQFKYIQNDCNHQTTNTECGMYSLFFIITWLTKKIHKDILKQSSSKMIGGKRIKMNLDAIIRLFTKPGINDQMMIRFRNIYFNKK